MASTAKGSGMSEFNEQPLGYSDAPSPEDQLGQQAYCEALATFVERCSTPMTLSIQGGWGTGKTTVLNKVRDILSENKDITIVEYNTWQYSALGLGDNLMLALLAQLDSQIAEKPNAPSKGDALKRIKNGLCNVIGSVAETKVGSIATTVVEAICNGTDKSEDPIAEIQNLKPSIQQAIKERTGSKGRLVVLVDDLDRLEPQVAVELLEGIKNFFDFENCVFVLAIDDDAVYQGIESKFGKSFGKKKEFFDKIIQLPFTLPTSLYEIEKYLCNEFHVKEEDAPKYRKAIETIARFDNNPRSIKRAFNLHELYRLLAKKSNLFDSEQDDFYLFAAVMMRMCERKEDTGSIAFDELVKAAQTNASQLKSLLDEKYGNLEETFGESDWKDEDFLMVLVKFAKMASSSPRMELGNDDLLPEWANCIEDVLNELKNSGNYRQDESTDTNGLLCFLGNDGKCVCKFSPKKDDHVNLIIYASDSNGITLDELSPAIDKYDKGKGNPGYVFIKEQSYLTIVKAEAIEHDKLMQALRMCGFDFNAPQGQDS